MCQKMMVYWWGKEYWLQKEYGQDFINIEKDFLYNEICDGD